MFFACTARDTQQKGDTRSGLETWNLSLAICLGLRVQVATFNLTVQDFEPKNSVTKNWKKNSAGMFLQIGGGMMTLVKTNMFISAFDDVFTISFVI